MDNTHTETAAQIQAASQAGASAIAEALQRAFDMTVEVTPGELQTCDSSNLPDQLAGAGLLFAMTLSQDSALAFLSDSSQWLPPWHASPSPEEAKRLNTLAFELGSSLLPNSLEMSDAQAGRVENLAESLRQAMPADEIAIVPLDLSSGETQARLFCIFPVENPRLAIATPTAGEAAKADPAEPGSADPVEPDSAELASQRVDPQSEEPKQESRAQQPARRRYQDFEDGVHLLPSYARSLLRIRVPVTVTLAETKVPLNQITDLAAGSIIQFKKPCDASLTLEVGDQSIAEGEAVKVGDKFGLWITSMAMPEERFWVLQGQRSQQRVK